MSSLDGRLASPATRLLLRQVQFVPLASLLTILLAGVFAPDYSSVSQHMSELGVMEHAVARVLHGGAVIGGASVMCFGLALVWHPWKCFRFSALTMMLFGVAYASGGIFHAGPLHGLYGATMCYVLVPAFFAVEIPARFRDTAFLRLSLLASLLSLAYMWFMFSGVEPQHLRGLTQRLAALVIFGWYPLASLWLLRSTSLADDGVRWSRHESIASA